MNAVREYGSGVSLAGLTAGTHVVTSDTAFHSESENLAWEYTIALDLS